MTRYDHALLEHLRTFLTPERWIRFKLVLEWRTRWITVVLSDLYQPHNVSAVLRSCEAFGVQDVHVVETENVFTTNSQIALGADRWLTLHRYRGNNSLSTCVTRLRQQGYLIAATVSQDDGLRLDELPLQRPVALLFGTEKEGLPDPALRAADLRVHVPMYGFVESFNVSVAAALSLQWLTYKLHAASQPWKLSVEERDHLLLDWCRGSIPGADAIEHRFHDEWTSARDAGG